MKTSFKALVVDRQEKGQAPAEVRDVAMADLPAAGGDVLVEVAYSSLNYKDGLAVTGKGKILRSLPGVPGIDLAGTVREVADPALANGFKVGDEVVVTGFGMGEATWGGYAQYARVKGPWLVRLNGDVGPRRAMAVGTAGLTAMLCVLALEEHGLKPGEKREVLVTGAAGGVGSVAVALLARLGYRVVASTGRVTEQGDYLHGLGAAEVLPRAALSTPSGKPLDPERWSAAVDCVGGETLASVLRQTRYGGSVAACGLAGGAGLPTSVLPFILRGVNLLGVDSVQCPLERRVAAWNRLWRDLDLPRLDAMTEVVPLGQVPRAAEQILAGQVRGRVVVDVNA